ncbi:MAG: type IV pilus secretin PilQ [Desulfococcaceae bacterium]
MRRKRRAFRAGVAVGLVAGCFFCGLAFGATASGEASSTSAREITQIEVVEQPEAVHVLIQGRPLLTYTSVKQSAPRGLILYFSNTGLATSQNFFVPPNPVLQSVTAAEVARDGVTSRVQLLLKRDALYEINRQGNGLKVVIDKTGLPAASAAEVSAARTAPPQPIPAMAPAETLTPPTMGETASRLQSVYAARFGDALKVFVGADGMITNYRSFTIDSPARIVFDLFDIRSPYPREKVVPVNTRWVSQIRYHNYPDRVRVIVDTQAAYLNQFSAHPVENGLLIHMGEGARRVEARHAGAPGPSSVPEGRRIESVYASQMDDGIRVAVRGDGPIRNYQTSTAENPARIIVDIPGVQTLYSEEQSFPVDTQWVRSVQHEQLSDRVRVTIQTRRSYLTAFTAEPNREGMEIRVGGPGSPTLASSTGRRPSGESRRSTGEPQPSSSSAASVGQIDFTGEEAGKSTLSIQTSRPVQYEVTETGDRGLEVRLFNTRLPREKRRPLITDRFESAVDRIEPRISAESPDTALFSVQLREGVPFFVEQEGRRLLVHFEASSIPPRPVAGIEVADGDEADSPPPPPSVPSDSRGTPSAMPPAPMDMPQTEDVGDAMESDLSEEAMEFDLSEEGMAAETGPRYSGEKIALDFFETDVRNVFRILREVSGMNFAIDKDVTGKVTLTLAQPVPWDQVLDLILKMNKLGKETEGNIIRIATRETLEEEEKLRQEKRTAELTLQDQQKQLEPLVTEYLPVNYSNAGREIQPHIEAILTKERGTVSVDDRTNVVIMTDTADKIAQAKELIRKLDRVTPQVIIEARVVEATTDFSRDIGTQWGTGLGVQSTELLDFGRPDLEDSNESGGLTDDVQDSLNNRVGFGPERGYNNLGGTYGYNMAMNFPVQAENFGSIGFNFVRIAGTPFLLNATLQALESKGEAKIISAPKVVTLDNKQAVIKQGISYPIQTVEDGEVNVEFVDVDLLLEVTPHVTPDNRISMSINITKNDLGQIIQNQQSFTTKEAQTELLVNDGDTVVIGGIIKTTERSDFSGIPGLSKIPILGWFFKTEGINDSKEELLIFITPRIVQLEQRTAQF